MLFRRTPKRLGAGTTIASVPPVNAVQCVMPHSTISWAASVAIARYRPFSRSEGRPKKVPASEVTTHARAMLTPHGSPALSVRSPAV